MPTSSARPSCAPISAIRGRCAPRCALPPSRSRSTTRPRRPRTRRSRSSPSPNPAVLRTANSLPLRRRPMPKQSGITFATHGGTALPGDLYTPDGPGPFPAMVVVHGGGWQQGTRNSYQGWGNLLAGAGIALFAVDYRLCKKEQKTYPEAVHDVRAAVQYLRGSAADLKIDPKRIGLWGDSAGAQLAALVALAGDAPLFAEGTRGDPFGGVSTKVKC